MRDVIGKCEICGIEVSEYTSVERVYRDDPKRELKIHTHCCDCDEEMMLSDEG